MFWVCFSGRIYVGVIWRVGVFWLSEEVGSFFLVLIWGEGKRAGSWGRGVFWDLEELRVGVGD